MIPKPLRQWLALALLGPAWPGLAAAQTEQAPAVRVPVLQAPTPIYAAAPQPAASARAVLSIAPEPAAPRRLEISPRRRTLLHLLFRLGAEMTAPGLDVREVRDRRGVDLALGYEVGTTVEAAAPRVLAAPAQPQPYYVLQPGVPVTVPVELPAARTPEAPPKAPGPRATLQAPQKAQGEPLGSDDVRAILKRLDSLHERLDALEGYPPGDRAPAPPAPGKGEEGGAE